MAVVTDVDAVHAAAEALDESMLKRPNIPVEIFAQEAQDLARWASPDVDALVKVGLDRKLLDELPHRIEVLRQAESEMGRPQIVCQREWQQKSPLGYKLQRELVRYFRHAFRNDDTLLARVRDIAKGASDADMVQDLRDLATLGSEQQAILKPTGFDVSLLKQAVTISREMETLLANVNAESPASPQRIMRDKAFAHVKQAVDEVRAHGQFAFRDNDAKRIGYVSEYMRRKQRRYAKQAAAAAATPAAQGPSVTPTTFAVEPAGQSAVPAAA